MGAWTVIYKRGVVGGLDPVGYAILAIKRELAFRGDNNPAMNLDTPVIGSAADANIRSFQRDYNLVADGQVGPMTARSLFERRARTAEANYKIPNNYVKRVVSLESAWDPAAIGFVDPDDHGLAQINLEFHPDITLAQATDPKFSLAYLAKALSNTYGSFGDWDAAVASWNVGVGGARYWLDNGKPASLMVSWFPGDLGARATHYLALIAGQKVL